MAAATLIVAFLLPLPSVVLFLVLFCRMKVPQPVALVFWKSQAGNEPVRDWLVELPREDKRVIGRDVAKVQFGWPIGLPVCRSIGGGLWEVRSSLPSKREGRVVFGFHDGRLIALHAFIKKARTAPAELEIARRRWMEVRS